MDELRSGGFSWILGGNKSTSCPLRYSALVDRGSGPNLADEQKPFDLLGEGFLQVKNINTAGTGFSLFIGAVPRRRKLNHSGYRFIQQGQDMLAGRVVNFQRDFAWKLGITDEDRNGFIRGEV